MKPLLTVEDVAALLRCTVDQVYSLTRRRCAARHGESASIPCIRLNGKNLRFREADIMAWLDRLATQGEER